MMRVIPAWVCRDPRPNARRRVGSDQEVFFIPSQLKFALSSLPRPSSDLLSKIVTMINFLIALINLKLPAIGSRPPLYQSKTIIVVLSNNNKTVSPAMGLEPTIS